MSTYDNLRRQCRTLESLLDAKLTSYSRLAANAEQEDLEASGSADRWRDLEEEVDGLLEKVCLLVECYINLALIVWWFGSLERQTASSILCLMILLLLRLNLWRGLLIGTGKFWPIMREMLKGRRFASLFEYLIYIILMGTNRQMLKKH